MNSSTYINQILSLEQKGKSKVPVDLKLVNGNILLRSFHILEFDESKMIIKGLTQQEEYSYPREGRVPQYCYLMISEIKEIYCTDLELVEHSSGEKVSI
jgi:hypothetical protein